MMKNRGEQHVLYGGKTRDQNGPMRSKILKQIGTHYHAEETPDCGLAIFMRSCLKTLPRCSLVILNRISIFIGSGSLKAH